MMFIKGEKLHTVPMATFEKMADKPATHVKIGIGNYKKSDAAKKIAAKLDYPDLDIIMRQLPVGNFRIE